MAESMSRTTAIRRNASWSLPSAIFQCIDPADPFAEVTVYKRYIRVKDNILIAASRLAAAVDIAGELAHLGQSGKVGLGREGQRLILRRQLFGQVVGIDDNEALTGDDTCDAVVTDEDLAR
jgi:hypothetical protein